MAGAYILVAEAMRGGDEAVHGGSADDAAVNMHAAVRDAHQV